MATLIIGCSIAFSDQVRNWIKNKQERKIERNRARNDEWEQLQRSNTERLHAIEKRASNNISPPPSYDALFRSATFPESYGIFQSENATAQQRIRGSGMGEWH